MIDLAARAVDKELLDEGVEEDEARKSLRDLRFVNRWLGGRRSLLQAVEPFLSGSSRVLDVGCGSADLPALLLRRARAPLLAVGLDLKVLHLREAPASVCRVAGDVRALPFAPGAFDVVTASLFLHHFDSPEVPVVLRSLYGLCRRALVINDLERAMVPLLFGKTFFPLLFRSRVSVADGLLSIRRAFTARELREGFEEAGISPVRIRASFPYRLTAVAAKG